MCCLYFTSTYSGRAQLTGCIVLSRGCWCWAMVDINSVEYCDLCMFALHRLMTVNELTDDLGDFTTPEVSLEGSNSQGSQETSGEVLTQSQDLLTVFSFDMDILLRFL